MIWQAQTPTQRAYLVDYIARRLDMTAEALVGTIPYEVFAAVQGDKIKGAVLYINYRGPSIEMTVAGEPGWLTKGHLAQLLAYPFLALKCRRITAIIHRKNKKSRQLIERLGFKFEGVSKHAFVDGDACMYGLIRAHCKWMETYHGIPQAGRAEAA